MPQQPNILLITCHDLGTHLGCYGWDPKLETPHLDGLAARGVRFENHFCAAPYCSPSRGAIMTGKYPHVSGMMGLANLGWDLPPGNVTLPRALKPAGYETMLFGFQHIAQDASRLGYDTVADCRSDRCRHVTPAVVAELARRGAEATPQPFYIEVGFSEVHRPYGGFDQIRVPAEDVTPLPFLEDTPGLRMDLAVFYENIRRLDDAVGAILNALDEAGLADHTLVIFTTDHGIAFPRAKATLYDPGIRTTLIMHEPGHIEGGDVFSRMLANVDLFPTLLALAGAPAREGINGRSFLPLLRGEPFEGREEIFAEKNTTPGDLKRAVRTARYKYIRNFDDGPLLQLATDLDVSPTRRDMGDAHLAPRPPVELYDLTEDPWEQNNLAGREDHADVEADMARRLQAILEATDDPILTGAVPRLPAEAPIFERIWQPDAMAKRRSREDKIIEEYERLTGKT